MMILVRMVVMSMWMTNLMRNSRLMNVMKMVVICCGKGEIVPMGVNMSGLCRAFPFPPSSLMPEVGPDLMMTSLSLVVVLTSKGYRRYIQITLLC